MSTVEKKPPLPTDAELVRRFAALEDAARTSLEQSRDRRGRASRRARLLNRLRRLRPAA